MTYDLKEVISIQISFIGPYVRSVCIKLELVAIMTNFVFQYFIVCNNYVKGHVPTYGE